LQPLTSGLAFESPFTGNEPAPLRLRPPGSQRPEPGAEVGNENARRSPRSTEADLQAKLDAARMRLHEIVILRMKTWLPAKTLKELPEVEAWRREQVRVRPRE
jgi:hypothetical protein